MGNTIVTSRAGQQAAGAEAAGPLRSLMTPRVLKLSASTAAGWPRSVSVEAAGGVGGTAPHSEIWGWPAFQRSKAIGAKD